MIDHDSDMTKPAKLVTYGSQVFFNLEDNFQTYLFGEGYQCQNIKLKKFVERNEITVSKDEDFSCCIFMILPFPNMTCFRYQTKLLEIINHQKAQLSGIGKLSERKSKINEFRNKLISELNFNLSTDQRSKGEKILLVNSNFMLFHLNTQQYVSMNINNSEKYQIELVEDPNKYCFFKFIPCLQLQIQRQDNFVYEQELFYMCSSETQSGKNPHISVNYKTIDYEDDNINPQQTIDHSYLYGSIDEKKAWKLNLWDLPNLDPPDSESFQYLNIGDVIWIVMSEFNYFLSANREKDPFQECFKNKKKQKTETLNYHLLQKKKSMIESDQNFKKNRHPAWDQEINDRNISELKEQLLQNYVTQYAQIQNVKMDKTTPQEEMLQLFEMDSNGLWRIESSNFQIGGQIEWYQRYRLRHMISGKYLCVDRVQNRQTLKTTYEIGLTNVRDKRSLFCFQKIENLMGKFENKINFNVNAYFRLQHIETKYYLGIDVEEIQLQQIQKNSCMKTKIFPFLKDINTFRIRKANFYDVWETNFLLSSIPPIIDLTLSVIDVGQNLTFTIEQKKKFAGFNNKFKIIMKILKSLQCFILNSLVKNMIQDEEFAYPSKRRQKIFRESCIFGLVCWVISKIFPTDQEFSNNQLNPSSDIIAQDQLSTMSSEKRQGILDQIYINRNETKQKEKDKLEKTCEQHLRKKFVIVYEMYEIVKFACFNNKENQNYFSDVLDRVFLNVGYGDFVSDALKFCLKNNNEVLSSLYHLEFPKEAAPSSAEQANVFSDEKDKDTENLLENLVKRLQRFEAYTKDDIIILLGNLCQIEDRAIYINQEKILFSFLNNRSIIYSYLFKVNNINNQIIVDKREKVDNEYEIKSYNIEQFDQQLNDPILKKYFIAQMELYSRMCAQRNYSCGKEFAKIFQEFILMKYIQNKNLKTDTKALFAKLLLNIHIDKEPRLIIIKPNLIRVFYDDEDSKPQVSLTNLNLESQNVIDTDVKFNTKNNFMGNKEKNTDIQFNSISKNIAGSEKQLRQMRILIKSIIKACYVEIIQNASITPVIFKRQDKRLVPLVNEPVEPKNEPIYIKDKIFNNLTLEIVKSFYTMLRFGMFSSCFDDKESIALMETIVEYLAFMLEYDEHYCNELGAHVPALRRKWCENQKKQEDQANQLPGFKNLNLGDVGGGIFKQFKGIAVMLGLADEDDEPEEDSIKLQQRAQDQQSSQGFLKMYQTLLKLLQKYQNKTYKRSEFNLSKSPEILIKIEICKIFNYLLDWREDFYLDNVMSYFKNNFYKKYSKTDIRHENDHKIDSSILSSLLPYEPICVGQEIPEKNENFFNYLENYRVEVKDFDRILMRSFQEVLLFSFYFSQDSELTNELVDLIYRYNNQRKTLVQNIQRVSLVQSTNYSYERLSRSINKLRVLYSQIQKWLQIVQSNKYDEKSEDTLNITIDQIKDFLEILIEKEDIKDIMLIQSMFKNLNGHIMIMNYIEIATSVFELGYQYFDTSSQNESDKKQESVFSYKYTFILKLYEIFRLCHTILSEFCKYNNFRNQKTMIKSYKTFLANQTYLNIGQVEFIQICFKGNYQICLRPETIIYLNYMVKLIKTHGHYPEFLELFSIILDLSKNETKQEIPQQILSILFDDDTIGYVNPFKQDITFQGVQKIPFYKQKDMQKYREVFIQIVTDCLNMNCEDSWITKVLNALPVSNLLNYLNQEVQENKITRRAYNLRKYLCDLMMIYFTKIENSRAQLQEEVNIFTSIIDRETDKIYKLPFIATWEMYYFLEHYLPLINCYCVYFLKDSVMISIMSIEDTQGYEAARKIYQFGQAIIDNLHKFFDVRHYNKIDKTLHQRLLNLAKIANNFQLIIPDKYEGIRLIVEKRKMEITSIDQYEEEEEYQKLLNKEMDELKVYEGKNLYSDVKLNFIRLKSVVKMLGVRHRLKQPDDSKRKVRKINILPKFQILWNSFKTQFANCNEVKVYIEEESIQFIKNILNIDQIIENPGEARDKQLLLRKEDMIVKFLYYLEFWKQKQSKQNSAIFVLKVFKNILSQEEELNEEKTNIQNLLDSLQLTRIILQLIWNEVDGDTFYLFHLLQVLNALLEGGNINVQESIYQIFMSNSSSEKFFKKISHVLDEEVKIVQKYNGAVSSIGSNTKDENKPIIEIVLRLLQLLCEGHNNKMQNYLRYQFNNKISYNFIVTIANLCTSFKVSNNTVGALIQSMDTLAELVQGPCVENQILISQQTKLLEWTVNILKEDPKSLVWIVEELCDNEFEEQKKKSKLAKKKKKKTVEEKPTEEVKIDPKEINQSNFSQGSKMIAQRQLYPNDKQVKSTNNLLSQVIPSQSNLPKHHHISNPQEDMHQSRDEITQNALKSSKIVTLQETQSKLPDKAPLMQQLDLSILVQTINQLESNTHLPEPNTKDSLISKIGDSQKLSTSKVVDSSKLSHSNLRAKTIKIQPIHGLDDMPLELIEEEPKLEQSILLTKNKPPQLQNFTQLLHDPKSSHRETPNMSIHRATPLPSRGVSPSNDKNQSGYDLPKQYKKIERIDVHRGNIAKIKHKCLITILSLLEMNDPQLGISQMIRRSMPIQVLENLIVDIYQKYVNQYKDGYYMKYFDKFDEEINIDAKEQEADELILEIGFNAFFIINILLLDEPQENLFLDPEQQEIKDIITENIQEMDLGEKQGNPFRDLSKIGSALISGLGALKDVAQKANQLTLSMQERERLQKQRAVEKLLKIKETKISAYKFFQDKTIQLEFVRKEKVFKCYFPLLPFCKMLPKEHKEEFHDEIDIDNPKGKLRLIMEQSSQLIEIMKHEESLRLIFETNFFLKLIASNKALWSNLSFFINLILNFIIMTSYNSNFQPLFEGEDRELVENPYVAYQYRMFDSRWFQLQQITWTSQLIFILGVLNMLFSSIVVSIFCIKKAPLLLRDMWYDWYYGDIGNKLIKFAWFFYTVIKSVYVCIMDFDFVFYTCYIVFCVLGLFLHPFFFGWGLLVDFLRIKLLKNVIKAAWIPRESLSLTFLLFLLIEYYFTLIAFVELSAMYEPGKCDYLWKCFLNNFDYTFKEGGGLGSFLSNPDSGEDNHIPPNAAYDEDGEVVGALRMMYGSQGYKLIFDNLFVWILPVLLISMVAGIIIDTFGSLKEESSEKEENYEQFCFICTYDREKIDKSYDFSNGFLFHIKKHHYLWNYVYFKAYIDFKHVTELNGNESFVVDQYKTLDVSWFPFRKSLVIIDEDNKEDIETDKKMKQIDEQNKNLTYELTTLQIRCVNINTE